MAELLERGKHFRRKKSFRQVRGRLPRPWHVAPEASRTRVLGRFRLPEPWEGRITRAWEACLSKKAPEYVFWTAQGPRTHSCFGGVRSPKTAKKKHHFGYILVPKSPTGANRGQPEPTGGYIHYGNSMLVLRDSYVSCMLVLRDPYV